MSNNPTAYFPPQPGYRNDSDSPFTSRDQLVAAMSDTRYARDATYRAKVEARMAKSNPADLGYAVERHHGYDLRLQPRSAYERTMPAAGLVDDGEPSW